MRPLPSKNQGLKHLLCVIEFFIKCKWVKPLKNKKSRTVFLCFVEIVNESKRKANRLWADQRREFYNSFMQKWLDDNGILTYSPR